VLDFGLPCALFVGTVQTPREQLLRTGPFLLAMLLAFVGLFCIGLMTGRGLFHHDTGRSALLGLSVGSPSGALIGLPILSGLFGSSSAIPIAASGLIASLLLNPVVLMFSGDDQSRAGKSCRARRCERRSP
jgi:predicted permease